MQRNKSKKLLKKIIKKIIFYEKILSQKEKINIFFDKHRHVSGQNKYTVVSAVYNVEKYLEDFFQSMVNQTLKFEDHIYLILVDDGSPDNSSQIIQKWQKKYPQNISYLKKENGGQASARNLGLEYTETEWVTFIDPDDFLHQRYFEEIDHSITNDSEKNIGLISCNTLFYYEKSNTYKDTHALKFRFQKNKKVVTPSNMEGYIQLSASSALFKKSLLDKSSLRFHTNIKPSFEDAHLVNRYLIANNDISVLFLKNAKYHYRKREDGSSTLDTSWKVPDRHDNVLRNGYLNLLKKAKSEFTTVPLYIQRTILYDIVWHLKVFLNNSHKLSHLTSQQKKIYLYLIEEIFQYIDTDTIINFELAGISPSEKIGLIGRFKQTTPSTQLCYISNYDQAKQEIQLRYYYYYEPSVEFRLNNKIVSPHIEKIQISNFVEEIFCYEKVIWLKVPKQSNELTVMYNDSIIDIELKGKLYHHYIPLIDIFKHFNHTRKLFFIQPIYKKYNNAWLFIDKDTQADDNAEHLYRYTKNNHSNLPIFFILKKNSTEWERLRKEGFNLINFGTIQHIMALLKAEHLISSHADHYITDFIPRRFFKQILKYKFTFLQHGVIHNDLSNWLNQKDIDCFITTCRREYDSIAGNYTPYTFTKKEVVLTGLPRHDALLLGQDKKEKNILIMPTWRQHLVGLTIGKTTKRNVNNHFEDSSYLHYWKTFVNSDKLQALVKKYDYTITFFAHPNIQPYLHLFEVPPYIQTLTDCDDSIQTLFQKASIMITDYSSVAFEMGVLQREVIYYQFDHDEMFSGIHTSQKGYFDYEKDGFGPVCYKEDEVLNALEKNLLTDSKVSDQYLKRMQDFFTYHDTNNCKRTFNAIENLTTNAI